MRITDERLDRTVDEQIAVTSTYTESEIEKYSTSLEDHDHRMLLAQLDPVVDEIRENETTRRALTSSVSPKMCIRGVQILVRDRIHVLSWFRSSDIAEYRDEDLGFLYLFGSKVRRELELDDKRLMVHVFTSSLHREVDEEDDTE